MRIIVYGCGQLASGVVRELLDQASEIVVLGDERSQLERLSSHPKVSGVLLSEPVMYDYLMEAGIAAADAFIALSHDDHENLLASQIALQMFNVRKVICHVENPQLQVVYTLVLPNSDSDERMWVFSYAVGILQDIKNTVVPDFPAAHR